MNLLWALAGVTLGTAVGVLPGIGPALTVALLLPVTYGLDPTAALIMFAGIYYGAMYGGSTTSILLNTPGESATIVTAIDGHQMARNGRAGAALATAAIGSFVAGTLATLALSVTAPLMVRLALAFGSAEYFALMVLAFVTVTTVLGRRRAAAGWLSLMLGLALGCVGIDGLERTGAFHLRYPLSARRHRSGHRRHWPVRHRRNVVDRQPRPGTGRAAAGPRLAVDDARGVVAVVEAVAARHRDRLSDGRAARRRRRVADADCRMRSRNGWRADPEEFGRGAIEAVAGPEAANNASAAGTLVPLLTLGLPTSATAAVLLAAFQQFGLQPGPLLFEHEPELVWGVIASLYVGNADAAGAQPAARRPVGEAARRSRGRGSTAASWSSPRSARSACIARPAT